MIERGEEQVAAAQVLEPIYRGGENWEKLIAIYELLSASSDVPERQAELLKEVGQIYEFKLDATSDRDLTEEEDGLDGGNRLKAFDAYGRAFAVTPGPFPQRAEVLACPKQGNAICDRNCLMSEGGVPFA